VVEDIRKVYKHRIDILYDCLSGLGFELEKPRATLYLWAWVGGDSVAFSKRLLEETGIVATPGLALASTERAT
jgi:LL-diaminopimelate aminotransferase